MHVAVIDVPAVLALAVPAAGELGRSCAHDCADLTGGEARQLADFIGSFDQHPKELLALGAFKGLQIRLNGTELDPGKRQRAVTLRAA